MKPNSLPSTYGLKDLWAFPAPPLGQASPSEASPQTQDSKTIPPLAEPRGRGAQD